jgi:hypothetical protein
MITVDCRCRTLQSWISRQLPLFAELHFCICCEYLNEQEQWELVVGAEKHLDVKGRQR